MNTELIKAGRQYRFWFYTTYSNADLHMRYNSERGYYTLSAYTGELWILFHHIDSQISLPSKVRPVLILFIKYWTIMLQTWP